MIAPSEFEGLNLDAARRALAAKFAAHGIESPELDARILLGEALGLDLSGLIAQGSRLMTVHDALILSSFERRRISGEPVARILGRKEFWGLPFELSPATLVPRPDTETLVEAALKFLREEKPRGENIRVADIGTGSGAILLALLSELPNAAGIGTDISAEAVETARRNAQKLGLIDRASFVACNFTAGLSGDFDLVMSNPPYIPTRQIGQLAVDVRDHDPHLTLDGGDDGLDAYRAIAPAAFALLTLGGALIFEVGQGQDSDVRAVMESAGFVVDEPPRADLAGVKRVVMGRKKPDEMHF